MTGQTAAVGEVAAARQSDKPARPPARVPAASRGQRCFAVASPLQRWVGMSRETQKKGGTSSKSEPPRPIFGAPHMWMIDRRRSEFDRCGNFGQLGGDVGQFLANPASSEAMPTTRDAAHNRRLQDHHGSASPVAQIWRPNSGQRLAEFGPKIGRFQANLGRSRAKIGLGRLRAKLGRTKTKAVRSRAKLGRSRAKFGRG